MYALIFDMDDTLYDQMQPFKKAYDDLFGDRFQINIRDLFARRSVRSDEAYEWQLAGKISERDQQIYRMVKAFEDLGETITAEEGLKYQQLYVENQGKLILEDTMTEVLRRLKEKNMMTGVITNGESEHQWMKIHALGLTDWIPEERIIVSGDCGITKPNPEAFWYTEKKLGLNREDCWFIGDNYVNDIQGAKAAGWKSIWLNKKGRVLTDAEEKPEFTVSCEAELLQCLAENFGI